MPEEILIIFVMSIISVTILSIIKMSLNYKRSGREERRTQQSDSGSLTTSELESMMRRAVEQSMSGLSGKIEDLELEIAKLSDSKRMLVAHDTSTRLELEDEVIEVDSIPSRNKTKA